MLGFINNIRICAYAKIRFIQIKYIGKLRLYKLKFDYIYFMVYIIYNIWYI